MVSFPQVFVYIAMLISTEQLHILPNGHNQNGSQVNRKSSLNSHQILEECRLSDIPGRVRNKLYIKAIHEGFDGKRLEEE